MKLNLKYYPQHTDYSCGPACLRMVFEHLGKQMTEAELMRRCHAGSVFGTSHRRMVEVITREHFACHQIRGGGLSNIIACVEAGYFAIINYQEPFSGESHYAVVSGYTDDHRSVILADPCNGFDFTISWSELGQRWHGLQKRSRGWMVVVGRDSINLENEKDR